MKHLFLAGAALAFFANANAQQDTSVAALNEVVVTATKFPQKQNTTGKVITVIGQEEIKRSAGKTLGQLLNEQAGITVNGALNNAGTNQSLYIRGASSGRALVLLDGIPVNDPSLINNEFDLNLFNLNNIERIEVCRGAQSTLYGSDAVAGVVNIITTRKDVSKPINLKASVSGGNFGSFRGNAQLYGKTGKLNYTARYGKTYTEGFSAAYDNSGKNDFENDRYNGDVANAQLQYQLTPELSLRSFIQYSKYKNGIDAGAFQDETDFTNTSKNLITGGGLRYNKNNISFVANYQYSDIRRNLLNDSLDVPGYAKFSDDKYYGKGTFVEAYASIGLGYGFTLLQGADYRASTMNNQYLSISSFGPFRSEFKDTSHSQASLYSSLFYASGNERLNIELGGRLNVHSRYGSNSTFTFSPSYNLSPSFRIFGSIASAFKAPSLYQLYSSYGDRELKPETSTNYEIGISQQHNVIQNRIVYFHRIIKNGLDFDNVNFKYFNFNEQIVKGIEFESSIKPVEQFALTLNYTYLKPEESSQSRVTFADTSYSYLLRRPQHQLNATASAKFFKALTLAVSGKYVSSRYDVGGYKAQDIKLGDYFLLGAYADFQLNNKINLFADAQNILGREFFDVRGYNSIPFIISGGIRIDL